MNFHHHLANSHQPNIWQSGDENDKICSFKDKIQYLNTGDIDNQAPQKHVKLMKRMTKINHMKRMTKFNHIEH